MTFEEADELMGRVTYRPGWRLRLVDHGGDLTRHIGTASLVVALEAENTHRRGQTVLVQHHRTLPPLAAFRDERQFLGALRSALGAVELHERDEWLKVDGEMPFDPHAAESARA